MTYLGKIMNEGAKDGLEALDAFFNANWLACTVILITWAFYLVIGYVIQKDKASQEFHYDND